MLIWRILAAIVLYLLQGFILGLTASMPLFLASNKASWKQQGTFSLVNYPFSLKILWAPIIDVFYIKRFGRHQTWLLPIQMLIGTTLLIVSFHMTFLLTNLHIGLLSTVFMFIYFLTASQDIVVDGWSIVLFSASNLQWSSTSQTIGQTIGEFFGSTILVTLESGNFTNKYIRSPLSIPDRSYGLFTINIHATGALDSSLSLAVSC
jgi:MFS transporter, PAT family, solute carrier family 33 (acetyl-CoA transportor), member 1